MHGGPVFFTQAGDAPEPTVFSPFFFGPGQGTHMSRPFFDRFFVVPDGLIGGHIFGSNGTLEAQSKFLPFSNRFQNVFEPFFFSPLVLEKKKLRTALANLCPNPLTNRAAI